MLTFTACSTTESITAQRAPSIELAPPPGAEVTIDDVQAAIEWLDASANFRYEYYQRVERDGDVVAGSLEVPLIRGEQSEGRRRFTAEMGVTLDFGDDPNTRMNLIASPESVCLNVPFYERVLGDSAAPPEFVWMIPLIDGWGCVAAARLSDTPDVLSIFGFEGPGQFLGVASLVLGGRLVAVENVSHRGQTVRRATIAVPAGVLGRRFESTGSVSTTAGEVETSLLLDTAGRIVSVGYAVELGAGRVATERLEVFDHGAVDAIEIPADALDISDDVLALLTASG